MLRRSVRDPPGLHVLDDVAFGMIEYLLEAFQSFDLELLGCHLRMRPKPGQDDHLASAHHEAVCHSISILHLHLEHNNA